MTVSRTHTFTQGVTQFTVVENYTPTSLAHALPNQIDACDLCTIAEELQPLGPIDMHIKVGETDRSACRVEISMDVTENRRLTRQLSLLSAYSGVAALFGLSAFPSLAPNAATAAPPPPDDNLGPRRSGLGDIARLIGGLIGLGIDYLVAMWHAAVRRVGFAAAS